MRGLSSAKTASCQRPARSCLALGVAGACALVAVQLCSYQRVAWTGSRPRPPPGPLALRERTKRLRDPQTGLPRAPPPEADVALDFFQRTFPEVTTEEHILIKRWEDIADVFGGAAAANELVLKDASILRTAKPRPRGAWHQYQRYLGPQLAKKVIWARPYLLTRRPGTLRFTLPALLNVLNTKENLAEFAVKYPGLMHVPRGDFYRAVPVMTAVMGNPEKALAVAKEAMEHIKAASFRPNVPECFPCLVALFGGFEEANDAIKREPTLLRYWGEQFLGKTLRLRELLGINSTQQVIRAAPYLLLPEGQKKARKFSYVFQSMERLFGKEETQRRLIERPELFALGVSLKRALEFAERKLGSIEAVRDSFDNVLSRTGLQEHLDEWETKSRPRRGAWTPQAGAPFGCNSNSWSPNANRLGRAGIARGRWDEQDLKADVVVDVEGIEIRGAEADDEFDDEWIEEDEE